MTWVVLHSSSKVIFMFNNKKKYMISSMFFLSCNHITLVINGCHGGVMWLMVVAHASCGCQWWLWFLACDGHGCKRVFLKIKIKGEVYIIFRVYLTIAHKILYYESFSDLRFIIILYYWKRIVSYSIVLLDSNKIVLDGGYLWFRKTIIIKKSSSP